MTEEQHNRLTHKDDALHMANRHAARHEYKAATYHIDTALALLEADMFELKNDIKRLKMIRRQYADRPNRPSTGATDKHRAAPTNTDEPCTINMPCFGMRK